MSWIAIVLALGGLPHAPVLATALQDLNSATVRATKLNGKWLVPVKVDGVNLTLLLSDDARTEIYTNSASAKKLDLTLNHTVYFDGVPMGRAVLPPAIPNTEIPGMDGVVGPEFLLHGALGFDLASSQITYWPGGISDHNAALWITGGERRYGEIGEPAAWSTDIRQDELRFFGVDAQIAGKPKFIRLCLSADDPQIPLHQIPAAQRILGQAVDGAHAIYSDAFKLGPLNAAHAFIEGGLVDPGYPANEGSIGVSFLNSRRVIVDLADERLFEQRLDPISETCLLWSEGLQVPLAIVDGRLCLADVREYPDLPLSKAAIPPGTPIIAIRGVPSDQFVKFFSLGAHHTFTQFGTMYHRLHGKARILTLLQGGKRVNYDLDTGTRK